MNHMVSSVFAAEPNMRCLECWIVHNQSNLFIDGAFSQKKFRLPTLM